MALPRVIATDLDGTLLDGSGAVTDRARQALNAAAEAGVRLVIVTARPARATDAIAAQFPCAAVVCANGAHTRLSDEPVLTRAMDRDTSGLVVDKLRSGLPDLGFGVETGTDFFHDVAYDRHLASWVPRLGVSGVLDDADALLEAASPVSKLLARSTTYPVHRMLESARESVGPLAEVTYSGGHGLLEVSAAGVTKGSTLALLCERWGVPREEVVAFGDMPNDLSALSWAGAGYAMANGHAELFAPELGLRVAPANLEHGVAQVVEGLLEAG